MKDFSVEDIDQLPSGLIRFTDDGKVHAINNYMVKLLGYADKSSIIGKHIETIFTIAGRIFYQTHFFPLIKMHEAVNEVFFTLATHSNERISTICNANRVVIDGITYNSCVFFPVKEREKYEQKLLAAKKTAEEALEKNEALVKAKKDLEVQAIALDRQLTHMQQNNADISQFSKLISHDLQEPIRKIAILADKVMLQGKGTMPEKVTTELAKVNEECRKLRYLATNLERFITLNIANDNFETVDLNQLVNDVLENIKTETGTSIIIHKQDLPAIQGYPAQLEMLFNNLFRNSLRHKLNNKTLELYIETGIVQQNSFRTIKSKYRYIDFVKIIVADNCKNYLPDRYEDIFLLQKKTDLKSLETGFELAFCKKIVENHNGNISAEFSTKYESSIVMLLPLVQDYV
jgi:sigma-B regulation protein RsbU (phosphoserine phosphatase)